MSISMMTKVFKDCSLEPNKKLVMLSLSDNANDEGFCYPSLNNIVLKTSLSRTTVIKHLKELEINQTLLSKKRSSSKGGRNSTMYIIYPLENIPKLDEDILKRFNIKISQGQRVVLPTQSQAAVPQMGTQGQRVVPKPSLTIFNHHLYKELDSTEKELYLEYCALRKSMKLQTTYKIHERLLNKYFEYGRDKNILKNAIISNWKDLYKPTINFKNSTFTGNATIAKANEMFSQIRQEDDTIFQGEIHE